MKPYWIMDAGHGWLAVPLETVDGVEVSWYSYYKDDVAYLEEDCDAGEWISHHRIPEEEWKGYPTTFVDGDWEGRRYDTFLPLKRA